MKVPSNYDKLTVKQFQELEALKLDKTLDPIDLACNRLSILTGKSIEYIESLSPTEVYTSLLSASYLMMPLKEMNCKLKFNIGMKLFKPITDINEFTVSHYRDITEFLRINEGNYIKCLPELLALCHKELTIKGYKYIQDNHFKNVELFKKAKLSKCMGAVFFYSKLSKRYSKTIKDYLEIQMGEVEKIVEEMNNNKGFLNFMSNGAGITQLAHV